MALLYMDYTMKGKPLMTPKQELEKYIEQTHEIAPEPVEGGTIQLPRKSIRPKNNIKFVL